MTCINVNKEQLAGIPLNKSPQETNGTEGLSCSEQHLWNGDPQWSRRKDPALLRWHRYSRHFDAHISHHTCCVLPYSSQTCHLLPHLLHCSPQLMGKGIGGKGSTKSSPEGQMHRGTAGEWETAQVPPAAEHPSAGAPPGAGALVCKHQPPGNTVPAFPGHTDCPVVLILRTCKELCQSSGTAAI